MNTLPHDLVISILSRSPVKSLVRFKSVSKSLYNLIEDPNFIQSHLHQSKNSHLIIRCDGMGGASNYYSARIDKNNCSLNLVREEFPGFPKHTVLIGSCNGIVCLLVYKPKDANDDEDGSNIGKVVDILLWNIATREYRVIPNPPVTHKYFRYSYGIGYDSVNNDYKVLRIGGPCHKSYHGEFTSYETQFYSLRRNAWSGTKEFPTTIFRLGISSFGDQIGDHLIYANNALYVSVRSRPHESRFALAIDLVTEEFGEVVLYPEGGWYDGWLVDIGGRLGIETIGNGVWVMKDYGVWTKLTFPDNGVDAIGSNCKSFEECYWFECFLEESKCQVLYTSDVKCHWRPFLYDKNKEEFEEIVNGSWSFPLARQRSSVSGARKCKQTLVSVRRGGA